MKHDPPGTPEVLSVSRIQAAIHGAIDLGFTHFALLGGEPSIREDVEQVFAPFNTDALPCDVMVVTNGLVFREPMYRSLFETRVNRARVIFSMDSVRAPNFKNQNPKECMQRILRIQAIAREYSKEDMDRDVSVHSVISRENLYDFGAFVKMFHRRGIDVSLALVCPSRFVERGNPRSFNVFTFDELDVILGQLNDLEREGKLNFANRTLLDYLRLYPFGELSMNTTCRAGKQHVIIGSDGGVYPCIRESYEDGCRFGNIREEGFRKIYRKMEGFRCESDFSSSCWDHFLWNRLGELFEEG